ncbi:UNVERIFIED_CONTAM: hypothetical protein FKN15_059007 [Acipenser sinensis]
MDFKSELLKSIWYAFTALDVEKNGKVSKSQLKVLSHNLYTALHIPHDPVALEEHFQDNDDGPVSNQGYMPYLNKYILAKANDGTFDKETFDDLCWMMTAKKNYKPGMEAGLCSRKDAFKLWCLFNMLSEDRYPLVMIPEEARANMAIEIAQKEAESEKQQLRIRELEITQQALEKALEAEIQARVMEELATVNQASLLEEEEDKLKQLRCLKEEQKALLQQTQREKHEILQDMTEKAQALKVASQELEKLQESRQKSNQFLEARANMAIEIAQKEAESEKQQLRIRELEITQQALEKALEAEIQARVMEELATVNQASLLEEEEDKLKQLRCLKEEQEALLQQTQREKHEILQDMTEKAQALKVASQELEKLQESRQKSNQFLEEAKKKLCRASCHVKHWNVQLNRIMKPISPGGPVGQGQPALNTEVPVHQRGAFTSNEFIVKKQLCNTDRRLSGAYSPNSQSEWPPWLYSEEEEEEEEEVQEQLRKVSLTETDRTRCETNRPSH